MSISSLLRSPYSVFQRLRFYSLSTTSRTRSRSCSRERSRERIRSLRRLSGMYIEKATTMIDNDVSEMWREHNEARQARHAKWKKINLRTIRESELACVIKSEVVLFRESGCHKIDFYPSTGRWRIVGKSKYAKKVFSGGAEKFLKWYQCRKER